MKEKLTEWFPADVSPVYPGVYETDEADNDGRCFAYWNGERFMLRSWQFGASAKVACAAARKWSICKTLRPGRVRWRGLAAPYEGWQP